MKLKTLFGYDEENYTVREEEDLHSDDIPADSEFTNGILNIYINVHGDAPNTPFIKIMALNSVTDDELFEIFCEILENDTETWFEYEKESSSSS